METFLTNPNGYQLVISENGWHFILIIICNKRLKKVPLCSNGTLKVRVLYKLNSKIFNFKYPVYSGYTSS